MKAVVKKATESVENRHDSIVVSSEKYNARMTGSIGIWQVQ